MKKTSKFLSSILLLGQVFGYTPTVLANEEKMELLIEQITNVSEEETMTQTTQEEETFPPIMSKDEEINDSMTEEIHPSESENRETADSCEEVIVPDQSPVETKPDEQPATKQSESGNQEMEQPTRFVKIVPQQQVTLKSSQSSKTAKDIQSEANAQEESKAYHQFLISPTQDVVFSNTQANKENIHFEKDESVETFIRKIGESARKIGQENDLYASVMIAQAILESASGQSKLAQAPNYNLLGIKGTYKGNSVSFVTKEDLGDGKIYTTQASFRQYDNYEDSLKDYAQLIKEGLTGNRHFYDGVWKTNAKNYQEATKFLTGRYATDTSYDKKLNGLIEMYDLTTYDKEIAGPQLNTKGYVVPLKNYTISSLFGSREGEFHRGLDLAAPQGEPIYASRAGMVIKAEFHSSWGNVVAVQHEDNTTALYAHQQEYQVKVGDKVEQGQIIGYVGSTGNSTGSHLHFELCLDHSLSPSKLIDPERTLF